MIAYKVIDLNTYARRAHLEYFMTMERPQLNLTAMVDVTLLKKYCKENDYSFFLSFLHLASLSADEIPQFRQRIHLLTPEELCDPKYVNKIEDGVLKNIEVREYEECLTSHTESTHDELYCYCVNHHHMPWEEYIVLAKQNQLRAREAGSLVEDKEIEACYYTTSLPWISYTEMAHPTINRYDSNPRISWGKFEENFKNRLMMPVTLTVHHGLIDGIHCAKFYENIESNMKKLIDGKLNG